MKLLKARIVVESADETSERWAKALQGKEKGKRDEEVISVESWEVLAKVLSPSRLQLLAAIPRLKPRSIAHLARELRKDFTNVCSDVRFLADLGLIELREEGARKTLVPVAKFSGIELPLAASYDAKFGRCVELLRSGELADRRSGFFQLGHGNCSLTILV